MRNLVLGLVLGFALTIGFATAQNAPRPTLRNIVPSVNGIARSQIRLRPVVVAPACGHSDCDGDHHLAPSEGGDDCNDNDPRTFPGNPEIADAGHDEDCDPSSIGVRDVDHDGFTDANMSNTAGDGSRITGDDCDDNHAFIHPGAQELPNHVDDDCNGAIDDLYGIWWTPPPGWAPSDGVPPPR
jgi:hypothetical protein